MLTLLSIHALAQQGAPLGTARLQVSGARLTIYGDSLTTDADQTLNVGEPARVRTCYGSGAACGGAASGSVPGLKVVGELTGPELPQAVSYETAPGGTFFLPGFQREGDYLLENIRLVDTATGRVLASAEPSLATLHVRQILLASATVTRLTLADLQARGIAITQQNFQAFGHVVYQNDGDEGASWARFDSLGRKYLEVLPTGARVERLYDQADRVMRETVTKVEKDPSDPTKTKTVTATLSQVTFDYAPYGLKKRTETIAADPANLDKEGGKREVALTYDSIGRVTDVVGKDPAVASSERHLREVRFKKDDTGRIDWEKDAFSNQTIYEIPDDAPWVKSVTLVEAGSSISTKTSFDRDTLGRVVSETLGNGTRIDKTLDEAGNVVSMLVGGINEIQSLYDGRGLTYSVTRMATGQRTLFGYDAGSRLTEKKVFGRSGGPDLTSFSYDTVGRLRGRTRPGSSQETFDYNSDGTVKKWTTRLKSASTQMPILFEYDAANNVKSRKIDPTFSSGAVPAGLVKPDAGDAFTYDALSRLLSASIQTGPAETDVLQSAKVSFTDYDRRGLPRSESVGAWGSPITRGYDVWGNATQLSYPSISSSPTSGIAAVSRTFDSLDRPTSVFLADAGGQAVGQHGADYVWGGLSRLLSTTTRGPASLAHTLSYQASGSRLDALSLSAGGGDLGRLGYTWDAARDEKSARTAGGAAARQLDALQGAGWSITHDSAQRMRAATAGSGNASGSGTGSWSYQYGAADELRRVDDLGAATSESYSSSYEGMPTTRGTITYRYDDEGRRTGDDRGSYTWDWRGRLAQADFLASSPINPGERVVFGYDALGRLLTRERRGALPEGTTDDAQRPFLEKRAYVWDGQSLLSETGLNYADQPAWRKQYVPGPGGLDDAVQVRVEDHLADAGSTSADYVFLRDEMGSVVGVAKDEVKNGRLQLLARYLYDPSGQAHIETGPELRRIFFDPNLTSVDNQAQALPVEGELFAGGFKVETTIAFDPDSLATGLQIERKTESIENEGWSAVPQADFAIAIETKDTPTLQIMRLAGWPKGSTWRIRLTPLLKDGFARALMIPDAGQTEVLALIEIPADGSTAPSYEKKYPFVYDSVRAASDTLGGLFPGGQNALYDGMWHDGATGWAFGRARWLDTRLGIWLSQDPLGDVDSPNLYGFVGMRPHEKTDPLGLAERTPEMKDQFCSMNPSRCSIWEREPIPGVDVETSTATGNPVTDLGQLHARGLNDVESMEVLGRRYSGSPRQNRTVTSIGKTIAPFGPYAEGMLYTSMFFAGPLPEVVGPITSIGSGSEMADAANAGRAAAAIRKPPMRPPQAAQRWTWSGHQSAALSEEQLAQTIHSLPDQVVVRWGDPIGAHGGDVISVNQKTGSVTLWDAKYRGADIMIQPSQTFSQAQRLQNAVDEAIATLRSNTDLPSAVRDTALQNLRRGTYETRTVGFGNARNSTLQ